MPAQMGGKENIGFRATGRILRSQYGLGFGIPMIGDKVKLYISASFQKERFHGEGTLRPGKRCVSGAVRDGAAKG
jgi:hypothetical protein